MMVLATGFALLLAAGPGEVFVARGDTLVISGTAVRLQGIDVPRDSRPQVERARREMHAIIQDRFVSCRVSDVTISDQRLGSCTAGGKDIAAALVARGFALDCERYSDGKYRALEPAGARDRLAASLDCWD